MTSLLRGDKMNETPIIWGNIGEYGKNKGVLYDDDGKCENVYWRSFEY